MEIGFIRLRKDCNKSQWPQLVNGQKQTQEWISSGFRKISRPFYLKKTLRGRMFEKSDSP